jgi:dipeptidyl aminopeptidase/acylaminoacyl peptidase
MTKISRGTLGFTFAVLASIGAAGGVPARLVAQTPDDPAKPVLLIETLEPLLFLAEGNPPDVTRDGRWLAFGTIDRSSRAERLVYVRDMTTGATRCLTDRESPEGWAMAPRWSPDGRWLAFFVRRNGRPTLAIWDRVKDQTSVVLDTPTPGLPTSVSWSERAAVLFVVTAPPPAPKPPPPSSGTPANGANGSPSKPPATVTTWRSIAAKRADERQRADSAAPDASGRAPVDDGFSASNAQGAAAHDVWRIALDEGEAPSIQRLVRGAAIQQIAVSPDGRSLALFGNRRLRSTPGQGSTSLVDLYVMPIEPARAGTPAAIIEEGTWTTAAGKTLAPIVKDVWQDNSRNGLSWAPDSHAIAWVSGGMRGSGDIFVVPVSNDGVQMPARNLTQAVPALKPSPAFVEDDDDRYPKFSFGNRQPNGAPLWTADARAIVRTGGDDVWYVPVDGKTPPRNLTAPQDSTHRFTSVLARIDPSGVRQAAGDRRSVLVQASDTVTLREGLWRLGLDDQSLTKLFEDDASLGIGEGYGDIVEPTGDVLTAKSSFNRPKELWMLSTAPASTTPASTTVATAEPQQLTSLNGSPPSWLSSLKRIDLQWKTPAGDAARGALVLPVSSGNGQLPPVVVHGYPGLRMATLGRGFGIQYSFEAFALLARGYAVFFPDIPMPPRHVDSGPSTPGPTREMVRNVEAAVAALVGTGQIDRHRIALHGHSYGGQMVNTLLTRSTVFAAGIAGSGPSNLTSNAGSSTGGMFYYESAQGRMGATLWAAPERYVENSPVFFLDRVTAPLLLYHGERDTLVSISEAEQMYRGLARLSGDVTLLRYRDQGHSLYQQGVWRDLFTRILAWLDSRLAAGSQSSH